ncbi:hypothetical protein BGZ80_009142 [Entomortierella chlamydospora]|uniref:Uncharacterized protein n=1 Tax=Entomortierella chlamydospora TaxID=101097 RepID=A0A9P6MXG6_9FUNG|nr:hypothetical protein BGZ79_008873 [Entomortierella chlamydospora]KAG0016548.1 hypothetical protein BGZ80_009142 [Entomortierella chlamydospora]
MVHGDIQCQQFGGDTFYVGSTIEFIWSDTGSVPIDTFTLDLYCYGNNVLIKTLATLSTSTSSSPQNWTVDQSIMNTLTECPSEQYQGRFDWTSTDPTTGAVTKGSTPCKSILLSGPGVPSPSGVSPPDPQQTDDSGDSMPEITHKTKMIIIGVGCAVGVLILAGIVGFYFIRYKNKRAEHDSANKKLRTPLSSSSDESGGFGSNQGGSAAHHDGLMGITTSNSGYVPVSKSEIEESEMVEVGGARPAPFTAQSYSNVRPASLLTSSFLPPDDNSRATMEREQHRQQYEQQMLHQQQLQHQHQQQQQQLSYGNY